MENNFNVAQGFRASKNKNLPNFNHGYNILKLFDTLPNFLFITSEIKCDY